MRVFNIFADKEEIIIPKEEISHASIDDLIIGSKKFLSEKDAKYKHYVDALYMQFSRKILTLINEKYLDVRTHKSKIKGAQSVEDILRLTFVPFTDTVLSGSVDSGNIESILLNNIKEYLDLLLSDAESLQDDSVVRSAKIALKNIVNKIMSTSQRHAENISLFYKKLQSHIQKELEPTDVRYKLLDIFIRYKFEGGAVDELLKMEGATADGILEIITDIIAPYVDEFIDSVDILPSKTPADETFNRAKSYFKDSTKYAEYKPEANTLFTSYQHKIFDAVTAISTSHFITPVTNDALLTIAYKAFIELVMTKGTTVENLDLRLIPFIKDKIIKEHPISDIAKPSEIVVETMTKAQRIANEAAILEKYKGMILSEIQKYLNQWGGVLTKTSGYGTREEVLQEMLPVFRSVLNDYDPSKGKFSTALVTYIKKGLQNLVNRLTSLKGGRRRKVGDELQMAPEQQSIHRQVGSGDEEGSDGTTEFIDTIKDISAYDPLSKLTFGSILSTISKNLESLSRNARSPELLMKTWELMQEKGFHGGAMKAISEELGVGESTLTVWRGKYIMPALFWSLGEITRDKAIEYSQYGMYPKDAILHLFNFENKHKHDKAKFKDIADIDAYNENVIGEINKLIIGENENITNKLIEKLKRKIIDMDLDNAGRKFFDYLLQHKFDKSAYQMGIKQFTITSVDAYRYINTYYLSAAKDVADINLPNQLYIDHAGTVIALAEPTKAEAALEKMKAELAKRSGSDKPYELFEKMMEYEFDNTKHEEIFKAVGIDAHTANTYLRKYILNYLVKELGTKIPEDFKGKGSPAISEDLMREFEVEKGWDKAEEEESEVGRALGYSTKEQVDTPE